MSRIQILLRLRVTQIITIRPLKRMVRVITKENSRKERRMVKEIIHLQLLMGKQSLFYVSENIGHVENT
jgi:hypothetical protein